MLLLLVALVTYITELLLDIQTIFSSSDVSCWLLEQNVAVVKVIFYILIIPSPGMDQRWKIVLCRMFNISYQIFKFQGENKVILRQEAVKLRLQDIEFPHFIQLSCFTKCHRCPRLDTQPCHETFYNIHFWIGLSLQSKKSIRTLTRGEYNLFEKYFHLFTIIWNLVNLVKWQFWRISHDLTAGESQDIGSCQNWNLREMIWGFSNFWN